MRESFRLNRELLGTHWSAPEKNFNLVFVYAPRKKKSTDDITYREIERDMRQLLILVTQEKLE